jgi:hypothetical protein
MTDKPAGGKPEYAYALDDPKVMDELVEKIQKFRNARDAGGAGSSRFQQHEAAWNRYKDHPGSFVLLCSKCKSTDLHRTSTRWSGGEQQALFTCHGCGKNSLARALIYDDCYREIGAVEQLTEGLSSKRTGGVKAELLDGLSDESFFSLKITLADGFSYTLHSSSPIIVDVQGKEEV